MSDLSWSEGLSVGLFLIILALLGWIWRLKDLVQQLRASNHELIKTQQIERLKMEKFIEQAKTSDHLKTAFLASISHELRTPLHGILSFSNMGESRMGQVDNDKLKSYFNAITQSGNRLLSLVSNLLDLSKLEAGQMQMSFKPFPVNWIVDNVIKEQASLIEEKQLQVIRACQDSEHCSEKIKVELDFNLISQVIANLLGNAIKFTPKKGKISFDCITKEQEEVPIWQLSMTNEGDGIAEEELEIIFNRFVQSEKHALQAGSGTGLGLSICKEIIEAHHGKIWAESKVGEFARFSFYLPIQQPTSSKQFKEDA